jgi:hypothetical protein
MSSHDSVSQHEFTADKEVTQLNGHIVDTGDGHNQALVLMYKTLIQKGGLEGLQYGGEAT